MHRGTSERRAHVRLVTSLATLDFFVPSTRGCGGRSRARARALSHLRTAALPAIQKRSFLCRHSPALSPPRGPPTPPLPSPPSPGPSRFSPRPSLEIPPPIARSRHFLGFSFHLALLLSRHPSLPSSLRLPSCAPFFPGHVVIYSFNSAAPWSTSKSSITCT